MKNISACNSLELSENYVVYNQKDQPIAIFAFPFLNIRVYLRSSRTKILFLIFNVRCYRSCIGLDDGFLFLDLFKEVVQYALAVALEPGEYQVEHEFILRHPLGR